MYEYYLRASLHDEHFPLELQFDYKWVPGVPDKPNVTISFVRRPISVDVEQYGLISSSDIQI